MRHRPRLERALMQAQVQIRNGLECPKHCRERPNCSTATCDTDQGISQRWCKSKRESKADWDAQSDIKSARRSTATTMMPTKAGASVDAIQKKNANTKRTRMLKASPRAPDGARPQLRHLPRREPALIQIQGANPKWTPMPKAPQKTPKNMRPRLQRRPRRKPALSQNPRRNSKADSNTQHVTKEARS
jgi:hypothetical protein